MTGTCKDKQLKEGLSAAVQVLSLEYAKADRELAEAARKAILRYFKSLEPAE